MFITFEGCEGSGKTTQCALLKNFFLSKGIDCILTKEPGGTELANKIRKIVLETDISDPTTEFLLLSAARREHIHKVIMPSLSSAHVICDRFLDSSLVYQGYAKGLNIDDMIAFHDKYISVLRPDITFLLDIDPNKSIARISSRNQLNHYDNMPIEFHKKIRDGFLHIAETFNNRIVVLNSDTTKQDLFSKIIEVISNYQPYR